MEGRAANVANQIQNKGEKIASERVVLPAGVHLCVGMSVRFSRSGVSGVKC